MKFVIFSGTTEGRRLSLALAEQGAEVLVSVATDYGEEIQGIAPGLSVHVGPLSREEKLEALSGTALCVDATHPYATHVTRSVREACEACGCPYKRLLRRESAEEQEGLRFFVSSAAAAEYLSRSEGNVLLTTGARELPDFAALDPARLYPRVLPSHEALNACEALGVPRKNVIAMQGPFTRELNEALIRQYAIRYVVSKDGGVPGGFPEKRDAALSTGAELLVLRRPAEEGESYEEVLAYCEALLRRDVVQGNS